MSELLSMLDYLEQHLTKIDDEYKKKLKIVNDFPDELKRTVLLNLIINLQHTNSAMQVSCSIFRILKVELNIISENQNIIHSELKKIRPKIQSLSTQSEYSEKDITTIKDKMGRIIHNLSPLIERFKETEKNESKDI